MLKEIQLGIPIFHDRIHKATVEENVRFCSDPDHPNVQILHKPPLNLINGILTFIVACDICQDDLPQPFFVTEEKLAHPNPRYPGNQMSVTTIFTAADSQDNNSGITLTRNIFGADQDGNSVLVASQNIQVPAGMILLQDTNIRL